MPPPEEYSASRCDATCPVAGGTPVARCWPAHDAQLASVPEPCGGPDVDVPDVVFPDADEEGAAGLLFPPPQAAVESASTVTARIPLTSHSNTDVCLSSSLQANASRQRPIA